MNLQLGLGVSRWLGAIAAIVGITWANNLAGSTNTNQIIPLIDTPGGHTDLPVNIFRFGTGFSNNGKLNFPAGVLAIGRRNSANDADQSFIAFGSANSFTIGDPNAGAGVLQGSRLSFTIGATERAFVNASGLTLPGLTASQVVTTGAGGLLTSTALGGDVTGSIGTTVVSKVNGTSIPAGGALVIGNGPYASGVSALTYSALNLAGGSGWVTGALPTANQVNQAMVGDVTGTTGASVVAKANGATIPAAGALTTGNGLYVTGVNALGYSALNLAGGANFVTGTLPVGNLPALLGDTTGTITANTVGKINGATVPAAGALTVGHVLQVSGASATSYGFVADANVAAAAAIAGSKIAPDFGSQNVTTTGLFKLADGSLSTPSITFSSQPKMGLYAAGTNILGIAFDTASGPQINIPAGVVFVGGDDTAVNAAINGITLVSGNNLDTSSASSAGDLEFQTGTATNGGAGNFRVDLGFSNSLGTSGGNCLFTCGDNVIGMGGEFSINGGAAGSADGQTGGGFTFNGGVASTSGSIAGSFIVNGGTGTAPARGGSIELHSGAGAQVGSILLDLAAGATNNSAQLEMQIGSARKIGFGRYIGAGAGDMIMLMSDVTTAPNEAPVSSLGLYSQSGGILKSRSAGSKVATLSSATVNTTGACQTGSLTLASGTKTISTGIEITASSVVDFQLKTPGGTLGAMYKYTVTVGAPGTGAFTVTSITAAGVTVTTDTSTLTYTIVG